VSAYPAEVLADILVGKPFRTPFLEGYLTPGGSYILASPACMTDDGQLHDLAIVLPFLPGVVDVGEVALVPMRMSAHLTPLANALREGNRHGH